LLPRRAGIIDQADKTRSEIGRVTTSISISEGLAGSHFFKDQQFCLDERGKTTVRSVGDKIKLWITQNGAPEKIEVEGHTSGRHISERQKKRAASSDQDIDEAIYQHFRGNHQAISCEPHDVAFKSNIELGFLRASIVALELQLYLRKISVDNVIVVPSTFSSCAIVSEGSPCRHDAGHATGGTESDRKVEISIRTAKVPPKKLATAAN